MKAYYEATSKDELDAKCKELHEDGFTFSLEFDQRTSDNKPCIIIVINDCDQLCMHANDKHGMEIWK